MKKNVIMVVVTCLVLAFTATMVSANQGKKPCPGEPPKLTDAQKQEMAPLFEKMKDLRLQMFEVEKQMIQKQVSFGNMTQEEADKHIARMQERLNKGPGPDRMGPPPEGMHGGPQEPQL